MVKILVFDTETTGIPPIIPDITWKERQQFDATLLKPEHLDSSWGQVLRNWPSILQLSYILYDTEDPENAKIFNKYIDIPDNIVISEDSMAIHHITREKIQSAPPENRGTIDQALKEFIDDVKLAELVIGHNVQFDRKMVVAELLRMGKENNLPQLNDMMNDANFECTMNETTEVCNLKYKQNYIDKNGIATFFYKIKSPKLSEAYKHFFGYEPTGEALHDALVDVVVCLRIFCKYKYQRDICGENTIITDYIKAISPEGYICPHEITLTKGGKRSKSNKSNSSKSNKSNKSSRSNKSNRSSSSKSKKPKKSKKTKSKSNK